MFGSSLPPFVFRRVFVLFTLFVFTCVQWCLTHIVLCFLFVCCRLVYLMLPLSLDFPPFRYSLMFISKKKKVTYTDTNKLEGRTLIGHITFPSVNKSREVVVIYKVNQLSIIKDIKISYQIYFNQYSITCTISTSFFRTHMSHHPTCISVAYYD